MIHQHVKKYVYHGIMAYVDHIHMTKKKNNVILVIQIQDYLDGNQWKI